jgi:hypothetical protein
MLADIATASASDDLAGIAHRPKITTAATIRNEHSSGNSGQHRPILKTEGKKQVAPDRRDWEFVLILDIIELLRLKILCSQTAPISFGSAASVQHKRCTRVAPRRGLRLPHNENKILIWGSIMGLSRNAYNENPRSHHRGPPRFAKAFAYSLMAHPASVAPAHTPVWKMP